MFKLLFMGALIYYAYRFIISPPALDDHYDDDEPSGQNMESGHDDEYVDYEEVD